MNYLVAFSIFTVALLLSSCTVGQNDNPLSSSEKKTRTSESPTSIFKEMSEKVKELEREDGLSELMKPYMKEEGTTAFDEVMKEIQDHDDASGGQVSNMIDMILASAEEELGLDLSKSMEQAMELANRVPKELKANANEIYDTLDNAGHAETAKHILEGIHDFLETGDENAGIDKLLREVVDMTVKKDPSLANSELIKEAEEILRNNLSAEEEAERIFKKLFSTHKDLIEHAKKYQ